MFGFAGWQGIFFGHRRFWKTGLASGRNNGGQTGDGGSDPSGWAEGGREEVRVWGAQRRMCWKRASVRVRGGRSCGGGGGGQLDFLLPPSTTRSHHRGNIACRRRRWQSASHRLLFGRGGTCWCGRKSWSDQPGETSVEETRPEWERAAAAAEFPWRRRVWTFGVEASEVEIGRKNTQTMQRKWVSGSLLLAADGYRSWIQHSIKIWTSNVAYSFITNNAFVI